jgi:hypothetical protein
LFKGLIGEAVLLYKFGNVDGVRDIIITDRFNTFQFNTFRFNIQFFLHGGYDTMTTLYPMIRVGRRARDPRHKKRKVENVQSKDETETWGRLRGKIELKS